MLSLEQGLDLHAEGKVRASLLRNSLSRVLLAQQEVVALELRDRRLYTVLCSFLSKFLPRTIHTKRREGALVAYLQRRRLLCRQFILFHVIIYTQNAIIIS